MIKKHLKSVLTLTLIALIFYHCQEPDTNPPSISLLGKDTVRLELNSIYNDPGATASDPEEGNLDKHILITSEVNYSTTGAYEIYYTVTDQGGNKAEVSRHIIIYNQAEVFNGVYQATAIETSGSTIIYDDHLQADAQENHHLRSSNFLNDSIEVLIFARNDSAFIGKQEIIYQQDTLKIHSSAYGMLDSTGFQLYFHLTKPDSSLVQFYNVKYDFTSPL